MPNKQRRMDTTRRLHRDNRLAGSRAWDLVSKNANITRDVSDVPSRFDVLGVVGDGLSLNSSR